VNKDYNDSTRRLLAEAEANATRQHIVNTRVSLLCRPCDGTVERVQDVYPNKTVLLECGHRRPLALRAVSVAEAA
jgi:hypothetical protein